MRALVTQYVLSRGLRIAAVVLVGVLGVAVLRFLPAKDPVWVLLRLSVLLSVLAWVFARLKSAALSFFLGTLLGLLLFQQPLDAYVQQLFTQAQSSIVFLIVLFGATLAMVSRQDLLEALLRLRSVAHLSPEQARLHNEATVFCLLQRFDAWTQRTVTSLLGRGVVVFCLALANFVSSSPAVIFFKSLWAPGQEDFLTQEDDRALAAGILCLCMSGVLLVYTGAGRLMSPWWLFFTENVSKSNAAFFPTWPVGALAYGLLSFLHGFWLIFCRSSRRAEAGWTPALDVAQQRLNSLYLVVLLICLVAVTLVFTVIIPPGHQQLTQRLATVFLGVLLATLLAQFLMYTFFMRPAEEIWQARAFWDLMMQGMGRVFGTVVTLVVLMAFKDMVTTFLPKQNTRLAGILPWMDTTGGQVAWAALMLILTMQIGRIIGSAWGTFALGLIMLDMLGITDATRGVPPHIGRTVVEALIMLATWVNQSSPSADNVLAMLGPARCTRETIDAVWAVPTSAHYTTLRAKHLQYALLGVSSALAWLCHSWWRDVL